MVTDAYAVCFRIARGHYENFPVASWLLPRAMRPHIAAIYAFARTADDFADEGTRTPGDRLALLDDWHRRLHASPINHLVGDFANRNYLRGDLFADADAVFTALGETIRSLHLDIGLFDDLLSAFRQDVTVSRYETWDDVLDYCRRSASPVGRLVLRVAGHTDAELDASSDALCTALQLTNFWQDLARDWEKGRLYVPSEIAREHGARTADLDARQWTPEWRRAIAEVAGRTRALFERGRPVTDGVSGRLRFELRATWHGGVRILDRLDAAGYDVLKARPSLSWVDALSIGAGMLTWRRIGNRQSR